MGKNSFQRLLLTFSRLLLRSDLIYNFFFDNQLSINYWISLQRFKLILFNFLVLSN